MNLQRLFKQLHVVFFSHASSTGIALLGEQATSLVHTCFMDCSKTWYSEDESCWPWWSCPLHFICPALWFPPNKTYFFPVLTDKHKLYNHTKMRWGIWPQHALSVERADLTHMFWPCPRSSPLWLRIFKIFKDNSYIMLLHNHLLQKSLKINLK